MFSKGYFCVLIIKLKSESKGDAKIMPLLVHVRRSHGQRDDVQNRRSVGKPLPRPVRNIALQKEQ